MFCSCCGKELEPDTKFCPDCGTKVGEAVTIAGETVNSVTVGITEEIQEIKNNIDVPETKLNEIAEEEGIQSNAEASSEVTEPQAFVNEIPEGNAVQSNIEAPAEMTEPRAFVNEIPEGNAVQANVETPAEVTEAFVNEMPEEIAVQSNVEASSEVTEPQAFVNEIPEEVAVQSNEGAPAEVTATQAFANEMSDEAVVQSNSGVNNGETGIITVQPDQPILNEDQNRQDQPVLNEMANRQNQPVTNGMPNQPDQPVTNGMPNQPDQPIPNGMPNQQGQPYPNGMQYQQGQPYPNGMPYRQGQPYPNGMPYQQGQPYPYGMPYQQMGRQLPPKKKRGFGLAFLTVFLAILMSCFLIGYLAQSTVVKCISPEQITEVINETDLEKVEVGKIIKDLDIEIEGLNKRKIKDDMTLTELVCELIPDDIRDELNLDAESVAEIMKESEVKDFISSKLGDYANSIGNDDVEASITKDDVMKLIKKTRNTIENITGYSISDDDIDSISDKLDEYDFEELDSSNIKDKIAENAPELPHWIFKFVTSAFSWVLLGAVAVFAVLILLTNVKYPRLGFRAIANVGIVVGAFFSGIAAAMKFGFAELANIADYGKGIFETLENGIANNLLFRSLVTLGAGIVLMIIVVIWKEIANHIATKKFNN